MTTYTRAYVESILIDRAGSLLTLVGKDGTTVDGTNVDLNDAIASAVRKLDGTVADPTSVTTAEIQAISSDDFDALLDVAELRVLYSIRGNLIYVDTTAGPFTDRYSDIGDYLKEQIKALEDKIEEEHGLAGPVPQVGVIQREIASHDEDEV